MITVRFVDRFDAIPESLWKACFAPPREGLWWYRSLQNSGLDEQFTFLYALIEEDGRPIGVAPCFLADVPLETMVPKALMFLIVLPGKLWRGFSHQRTLFIGSPCSDEGWVGILPGIDRRQALLALYDAAQSEARRRKAPIVAWKDMPKAHKADMDWLGQQRKNFACPGYPNALVTFTGPRKEDYFTALKGTRRHQLKKKIKLSNQRVQVRLETLQNPSPAVLDEVFDLFSQTYERAEVKFERLPRRFFETIAKESESHFLLLREESSGALLAFMLCLVSGDLVINKFIGFDYSRPKDWLLYFRLWDVVLDWSLARGAKGIQSGQTCYQPKIEQGHALIPLFNYGRHKNPLMHWIYTKVAKTITWRSLDADLALYLDAHPEDDGSRP
jgi:hypothetical protein